MITRKSEKVYIFNKSRVIKEGPTLSNGPTLSKLISKIESEV